MNQILDLARRQGYVTASDVKALGAHRMQLTRLVRSGDLIHTVQSVYLPAEPFKPEESHARVTRAILAADPFAAASHHSALALHDLHLFDVPWTQVHVIDPRRSSVKHQSLHRHVLRPGDRVERLDGVRVIDLSLALCQVAARFGMVAGLVAMDHALQRDLCTPDDLMAVAESGRLRRGIGSVRRAVDLADGRAESPGESRLRAIIDAGPFRYDLQVNVGGPGSGYVVDMLVDGCVVVEFDGEVKYDGIEGKKALVAEKHREDWIRSRRYGFVRTMWPQLDYPNTLRRVIHDEVVSTRARRAA